MRRRNDFLFNQFHLLLLQDILYEILFRYWLMVKSKSVSIYYKGNLWISIVLISTDPLSKVVTTSYGPIQRVVNFPLKFVYLESNSNAQCPVLNCFFLINLSCHFFHWFYINIVLWSASCLISSNSLICNTRCFCASSKFMPNCVSIWKVLTWN